MDVRVRRPWFRAYDARGASQAEMRAVVRTAFAEPSVRTLHVSNAVAGADPLAFWHQVGSALGTSYSIREDAAIGTVRHVDHEWMDVRYDPSRQHSFRYASAAQPLHNDGAHVADAADIGLFYMAKQSGQGGESVLVDADTIARVAEATDPALFRDLVRVPVRMALAPGTGVDCPIMQHDGQRWTVRWNAYRVVPGQGERIDALRARFQEFLERLEASDAVEVMRLETGDALLFDDRAMLHGRRSFAAVESGDRVLWKTYFVR